MRVMVTIIMIMTMMSRDDVYDESSSLMILLHKCMVRNWMIGD